MGITVFLTGPVFQARSQGSEDSLGDSIQVSMKRGDFSKALGFSEKKLFALEKKQGLAGEEYGRHLQSHCGMLKRSGQISKADSILKYILNRQRNEIGPTHDAVIQSLNRLGKFHQEIGEVSVSEGFFREAMEIRKSKLGIRHPDYAASLVNLGVLFGSSGESGKAKSFLMEAIEIQEASLGSDHPDVASSWDNLGNIYSDFAENEKGKKAFQNAIRIRTKTLGNQHPDLAKSLSNLGVLQYHSGDYSGAEQSYLQALEIRRKALGQGHPEVGQSLNNLGILYHDRGDYRKAEPFYKESLSIKLNAYGESHPSVGISYCNLATLYSVLGDYTKSEIFYLKGLEILKRSLGENHPQVSRTEHNLGLLYYSQDQFEKAEPYYQKGLEMLKIKVGPRHPDVALASLNLGMLYGQMGEFRKAEPYYREALRIRKGAFGEGHIDIAQTQNNLGVLFINQGKYAEAEPWLLEGQKVHKRMVNRYFPHFSEIEQQSFMERIALEQSYFTSFCPLRYPSNPEIAGALYDYRLFFKGVLLFNSRKFKERIRNSNDSLIKARFREWEGLSDQIGRLFSGSDSVTFDSLRKIEIRAEQLEKDLILRSKDFKSISPAKDIGWKNIRSRLKPGEAAIEIVRIQKWGIKRTVPGSVQPGGQVIRIRGTTDTVWYLALIVKPDSKMPEMVFLKNGNDLENRWILKYRSCIENNLPDPDSYRHYRQFWEPLDKYLGNGIKRIFLSPDGVFHSLNPATLRNPESGKFLLDERDIRLVTNTRELISAVPPSSNPAYACMVGFPDYNIDHEARVKIARGTETY